MENIIFVYTEPVLKYSAGEFHVGSELTEHTFDKYIRWKISIWPSGSSAWGDA